MHLFGSGADVTIYRFKFLNYTQDKFGIAYPGFSISFGIYYLLKPALWIVCYWKDSSTLYFELKLTPLVIEGTQVRGNLEMELSVFKKIFKRNTHFVLATGNHQKIYLPNKYLFAQQINILKTIASAARA